MQQMAPQCRDNLALGIAAASQAVPAGHEYLVQGFCQAALGALHPEQATGGMGMDTPTHHMAGDAKKPPPDGAGAGAGAGAVAGAGAGAGARAGAGAGAVAGAGAPPGRVATKPLVKADPVGAAIGANVPVCHVAVLGHSKCQYSVLQSEELEQLRAAGMDQVPTVIMCDQVNDPRCATATAFPTFVTCDATQSNLAGFRQGDDLLAVLGVETNA